MNDLQTITVNLSTSDNFRPDTAIPPLLLDTIRQTLPRLSATLSAEPPGHVNPQMSRPALNDQQRRGDPQTADSSTPDTAMAWLLLDAIRQRISLGSGPLTREHFLNLRTIDNYAIAQIEIEQRE